jgi:hypothetical protein
MKNLNFTGNNNFTGENTFKNLTIIQDENKYIPNDLNISSAF